METLLTVQRPRHVQQFCGEMQKLRGGLHSADVDGRCSDVRHFVQEVFTKHGAEEQDWIPESVVCALKDKHSLSTTCVMDLNSSTLPKWWCSLCGAGPKTFPPSQHSTLSLKHTHTLTVLNESDQWFRQYKVHTHKNWLLIFSRSKTVEVY